MNPQYLIGTNAPGFQSYKTWSQFKNYLDQNFSSVITTGWEGANLDFLASYALGYQVLAKSDPATANNYAMKAIGILGTAVYGLTDPTDQDAQQIIGVSDGVTTTFPLPTNGTPDAPSFSVWVVSENTTQVTRSSNPSDFFAYYQKPIQIFDSTTTYVQGKDWKFDNTQLGNVIWLSGGNSPKLSANYNVISVSAWQAPLVTNYSVSGNSIVFTSPAPKGSVVIASYTYTDATGLKYQQTNNGMGGLASVNHGGGYSSRFLSNIPVAYDWLYSCPLFPAQLKKDTENLILTIANWIPNNEYNAGSLQSNYGAGAFVFVSAAIVALNNRVANSLAQYAKSYYTKFLNAISLNPLVDSSGNAIGSCYGGYWPEGWAYGALAITNILVGFTALQEAGFLTNPSVDMQKWAERTVNALIHTQPTQNTTFDNGDGYTYPLVQPSNTLFNVLEYSAGWLPEKQYAAYLTSVSPVQDMGWRNLVFASQNTPVDPKKVFPTSFHSIGAGLMVGRPDWTYSGTFVTFIGGNLVQADHQGYAQGNVELSRGNDLLLINASSKSGQQDIASKSRFSNTVVIDDGGAGYQNYPFAQGFWYGNPGVVQTYYDFTNKYTYATVDYASAYHNSNQPKDPATTLIRSVFYLRNNTTDYTFVYDRAVTLQSNFSKQLQWHLNATATVNGNTWQITLGNSTLIGTTYSTSPITTVQNLVQDNGVAINQIAVNPASQQTGINYLTMLQSSPATSAPVASTHIVANNAEGIQVGNTIVLFGINGQVTGPLTYSFMSPATGQNTHYLTDMIPSRNYLISGRTIPVTSNAQGVLTFNTDGYGKQRQITLTAV